MTKTCHISGGDFVLRGPDTILKSDQIVMRVIYHMAESRSLNGP